MRLKANDVDSIVRECFRLLSFKGSVFAMTPSITAPDGRWSVDMDKAVVSRIMGLIDRMHPVDKAIYYVTYARDDGEVHAHFAAVIQMLRSWLMTNVESAKVRENMLTLLVYVPMAYRQLHERNQAVLGDDLSGKAEVSTRFLAEQVGISKRSWFKNGYNAAWKGMLAAIGSARVDGDLKIYGMVDALLAEPVVQAVEEEVS